MLCRVTDVRDNSCKVHDGVQPQGVFIRVPFCGFRQLKIGQRSGRRAQIDQFAKNLIRRQPAAGKRRMQGRRIIIQLLLTIFESANRVCQIARENGCPHFQSAIDFSQDDAFVGFAGMQLEA